MTAYDMMLSESQERMLAVLKPGREAEAEAIFKKWELDFAVIGITTDTNRLVVKHKGEIVADMPVAALSDEAPVYERPFIKRAAAPGSAGLRSMPTARSRFADQDSSARRTCARAAGCGSNMTTR